MRIVAAVVVSLALAGAVNAQAQTSVWKLEGNLATTKGNNPETAEPNSSNLRSLNAQTVSPGAEAVPSAPTHSENSHFEGIYRGFAYFEFIIDGIVNRLLSTAPIESFKRPLPSTRQSSPRQVPVYIEATILQPAAAGPRTFVAFQLTGEDGRREELPTLLAVNTGALSWDLPLIDMKVGDRITEANNWYLTPSMFEELTSESTREICEALLHGGESFGVIDISDSDGSISGTLSFSISVDSEHCGRMMNITGNLYRWD